VRLKWLWWDLVDWFYIHVVCRVNRWIQIAAYHWKYATDPQFRQQVKNEMELATELRSAISEEINKEILEEIRKSQNETMGR